MKKVFRIILILLGLLVLLLIGAVSYIHFSGIPHYPTTLPKELVEKRVSLDSASIARGEKIASMLCVQCHMGTDNRLVGKLIPDMPVEFGKVSSYNITQDKEKGIGNWSDGELIYFLRTGIRTQDGSFAPPYMPKYCRMADQDIESVVAWLRSNNRNVQPSKEEQPANQPNLLVKFLCRTMIKPLPYQSGIPFPDTMNAVAYGKYLANDVYGCFGCHSADFKTVNDLEPEKSPGYYGGGNPLINMEGQVVPSQNITPDPESGIGKLTEEEFARLLTSGIRPDKTTFRYPMIPHANLNEREVKAIFAFLKTVPPIKNAY